MTSHTSHASMFEIPSFYGDREISKGLWSTRSPDVKPPVYFLWGYLKGRVYQNKPRSIDALKANITEEIQAVTADVLARTYQSMAHRVQFCLDANRCHFKNMLCCHHTSYTMRQFRFKFRFNIHICSKIIREMPSLVGGWTLCIYTQIYVHTYLHIYIIMNK
jgi:hypothetical protein